MATLKEALRSFTFSGVKSNRLVGWVVAVVLLPWAGLSVNAGILLDIPWSVIATLVIIIGGSMVTKSDDTGEKSA